jgi:hypothetical protein
MKRDGAGLAFQTEFDFCRLNGGLEGFNGDVFMGGWVQA